MTGIDYKIMKTKCIDDYFLDAEYYRLITPKYIKLVDIRECIVELSFHKLTNGKVDSIMKTLLSTFPYVDNVYDVINQHIERPRSIEEGIYITLVETIQRVAVMVHRQIIGNDSSLDYYSAEFIGWGTKYTVFIGVF